MNKKSVGLVILGLLLSFNAKALDKSLLQQARMQQQLSINGDEDATQKAFSLYEQLVKNNPSDPVFMASLGSMESLKGRDAFWPWNKMSYVEAGLDKIDKAIDMIEAENYQDSQLNQVWQSVGVRNIAANTFMSLPSMFNRYESGKEELEILLTSEKFLNSPKQIKNIVYSLAIKMAKDDENSALVKKYQALVQP